MMTEQEVRERLALVLGEKRKQMDLWEKNLGWSSEQDFEKCITMKLATEKAMGSVVWFNSAINVFCDVLQATLEERIEILNG